jgi:hypothetical protein
MSKIAFTDLVHGDWPHFEILLAHEHLDRPLGHYVVLQ